MNKTEIAVFEDLFHQVYLKCFGTRFEKILSEPEAKHLSDNIHEITGLVLGWKSLKNYSQDLLSHKGEITINPSIPTSDTLARYVANAPRTDEIKRKKSESHYPYWFDFKEKKLVELAIEHNSPSNGTPTAQAPRNHQIKRSAIFALLCFTIGAFCMVVYKMTLDNKKAELIEVFEQPFRMVEHGWSVLNQDPVYWKNHELDSGGLQLFCLPNDDSIELKGLHHLKNLLVRGVTYASFMAELHVDDFFPTKNWQQVGIVLMEDTIPKTKSLRFTIGFNDFFGGYQKNGEIILQILSALDNNNSKPEEIIQRPIFSLDSTQLKLIKRNMAKTALRIEKVKKTFRFLIAHGENDLFAFKEIAHKDLDLNPKFIGIFASSGNTPEPYTMPVRLKKFIFKKV